MKTALIVMLAAIAAGCAPLEEAGRPGPDVITPENVEQRRAERMANARAGMYGPDGVEKVSQGLTCSQPTPSGNGCEVWCPEPPKTNFFDCYTFRDPAPNLFLMFEGTDYQGCCAGTAGPVYHHWFDEWNDRVQSISNGRSQNVILWQEIYFWGARKDVPAGTNHPNLWASEPNFGVSSVWERAPGEARLRTP